MTSVDLNTLPQLCVCKWYLRSFSYKNNHQNRCTIHGFYCLSSTSWFAYVKNIKQAVAKNTVTFCIWLLTWVRLRQRSTCHRIARSTTQARKPQKCERQETKRIVLRWYWPDGLNGSEDDMVYKSTEDNWNNSELDFDQIFQSDSESDFEVFLA